MLQHPCLLTLVDVYTQFITGSIHNISHANLKCALWVLRKGVPCGIVLTLVYNAFLGIYLLLGTSWTPAASRRGTWGILLLEIVTRSHFILCVWLHIKYEFASTLPNELIAMTTFLRF